MFVKNLNSGDLAQVDKLSELTDPTAKSVTLHYFAGEEVGEPELVEKSELIFPSGENLPKCWLDSHYRITF